MKTIKTRLLTIAVLLCSISASAYDFEVDGIYYHISSMEKLTVSVTFGDNEYSGEIIIPEEVVLKGKTLKVTGIGDEAFYDCDGLTSITIPNSVTSIGNNAFRNCTSLKVLYFEDGANTINLGRGEYYNSWGGYYLSLFYDCPLETLYLGRNVSFDGSHSPFEGKRTLISVTIGNSVTSIGDDAFRDCSSLTSITIPNSVTSIGNKAFGGCDALTELIIAATVPPTVDSSNFDNSDYINMIVKVPEGSLEAYQAADVWKNFWDIQEEEIIVIETQPTAENLQVELNTSEEGVRYQWYQYVEGMICSKEIVPTSSGPFAWTESNGIWTSGNNIEGSQTFSVMTATVKVQLGDTISFDYTVPKGDGSYSGGSQWFEFTLKGETYMQTFGGKNGHANHFELHINNYIIDRKLNEDSTMTVGFECVRTNSERATVSNIKHIRPTGFYRRMVDEEIVGATTARLDESLFNKGNIVYCVVTLPNGTTIISDEVQTTIDGTKIEEVVSNTTNGYIVYNLYGTLVMRTMDKSDLNNLPQGIYIINNKKMFVK